jgi:hypothetical protein
MFDLVGAINCRIARAVISYRFEIAQARARHGRREFDLPERWAKRAKIVELPPAGTTRS